MTLVSHPYNPQYGFVNQQQQAQQPQGPPSPPMDDTRCSLPSISNLLDLADQGSPTSESSPQTQQMQQQLSSQLLQQSTDVMTSLPSRPSTRPSSSHFSAALNSRGGILPPTPPMTSKTPFGSPSIKPDPQMFIATAPVAATAPSNYYCETTPPPQYDSYELARHNSLPAPPHAHRQTSPAHHAALVQRHGSLRTPATYRSPMNTVAYALGQATGMSGSLQPYYPPMHTAPQPPTQMSLYQRPVPAFIPLSMQPSPWQHHHYIAPSAGGAFPASQDRYICATCNKAFSRPSSLRIHSHSHTGEKPYKCPHKGCGKAFSVRSNMKRHERGCHSYGR